MDNLTHTLFAATLARTGLGRAGRGATAVLVLGSNAPDVDVVSLVDGSLGYLDWHRGPTHGPLGVLLLGAATGWLVWAFIRARDVRRPPSAAGPPATPGVLVALGVLAVALHIAMDLPTSYGTRALSPFDDTWFTTDWMPIVDLYLLALLAAGLAAGRRSAALAVLLLMAVNYGVRAAAHDRAIAAAPRLFGPRLPAPCPGEPPPAVSRWEDRPRLPRAPGRDERCLAEVAAIPTFLSPFRWQVIARTSNAYEIQEVDLLAGEGGRRQPWRSSRRVPDQWTPAVLRAAESEVAARFLSFSRFPAVRSTLEDDGSTTVRWVDLRFAPTAGTPRASPDRRRLFSATVRVGADGRILEQRLGE